MSLADKARVGDLERRIAYLERVVDELRVIVARTAEKPKEEQKRPVLRMPK